MEPARMPLPAAVLARLDSVEAAEPEPYMETPEDAAARRAIVSEREHRKADAHRMFREARYQRRLPHRFANADLADLTTDQDVGGRVSGWLASGHETLLLAATTSGVGKTHAAYAVARQALAEGAWVEAWTSTSLLASLKPSSPVPEETLSDAIACDLLFIDDLGRERLTEWVEEQLHLIVDQRHVENRRLIVTTNLTGQEMIERYSGPFAERLIEDAVIVKVQGTSRRKPAAW